MSRRKLAMILVVTAAAIATVAWAVKGRGHEDPTALPAARVERRDLSSTVTATGAVQAEVGAEVKVGSRVSGRVEKLYANVGDQVHTGQVIALIDDREARAKVDQAQAALLAAESRWQQATAASGAQPGESDAAVKQATAAVAAASAYKVQAETAAAAQPVTTESQIEQARRALAASQARLAQARETAAATPESVNSTIAEAEAGVQAAEANLQRVQRGARSEEIARAKAAVDQAQAKFTEADANLTRTQALYEQSYIAAQDLDHSKAARQVALGDLQAAQQHLQELKTQTLPEDLDKAKAQVAQAKAALAVARSASVQISLRQGDVTAAEADVRRAQAALKAAEASRSQDAIAEQQAASARADLAKARAGLRSAELGRVQNELKQRDAEAAGDQVTQADADLRAAEAELSYTRIVAPIDGIIASVATQEGETVSAGLQAPTFVTIIDLHRLEVDAYVDETDIGKVKLGQEATFTVDAYGDRDFSGKVTAIYPKALKEQNVVEYDVVISIRATGGLLKPDMTANVTIAAETHEHVLTVPTKAIRREGGKKVVYVVRDGRPVATPVKTGVRNSAYTEVVSGVTEGAVVLLEEPEGQRNRREPPPPALP